MEKNILYSKFERFWHWTQMALVIILLLTGFEIHGELKIFSFEYAVRLHNSAAWAFMGLTAITIFWMFSVGHWKVYAPTKKNLKEQIRYYSYGIFRKEPSPHNEKTRDNKFNPLQRIIYLGLVILAFPAQIITGLIYMYFRYPGNPVDAEALRAIAVIHTILAFLLVAFLIIHLYMTTTGQKITSHIKEMITGEGELHNPETKTINQK